jgi:2-C-methyl-D-erythritol 4-phosphate cytidylyltransferase
VSATALIAAAGSGQRLGAGGPKAFADVAGRPLLEWSLLAASAAESIDAIVVAAPGGDGCERASELIAGLDGIQAEVVAGGATRAESVSAALEWTDTELVLVHDAARPLAGADLFDAIVARLERSPSAAAVIAATPVADTLKRAGAHQTAAGLGEVPSVLETVSRADLWAAQTPQGFRVDRLREAQERAQARGELVDATDEARLIERAGGTVLLEPAPASNLKITTPDDLALAATLLSA